MSLVTSLFALAVPEADLIVKAVESAKALTFGTRTKAVSVVVTQELADKVIPLLGNPYEGLYFEINNGVAGGMAIRLQGEE